MENSHEFYMNLAYQEALKAFDEGEVPIGAVIVKDGAILGRGYNRIEALNDPTAHAEILAIGAATEALNTWRLNECTIYVTLEPCLMCLGALMQSRIDRIIYGAADNKFGAIETFRYKDLAFESYRRFPETLGGIMLEECRGLIQTFFKNIRKKN
jgi:tRNA(adenine34) deaminase